MAEGQTSLNPDVATPMTTNTTFWIASCTKLITTVAALQCVEKGLLQLDAPIYEVLPEWKAPEILTGFDGLGEPQLKPATKKITLRQLLTHSSGMGYDFLSPDLASWRQWKGQPLGASDEPIIMRQALPLLYEPGDGWMYSVAIDWVGKMVERVNGGVRLGEYMKQHILDPLGMTSTSFSLAENEHIRDRLCATAQRTADGKLTMSNPYNPLNPADDSGGGGLYSSVADYMKVLISLLKNDGLLLRPDTVTIMFEPQLDDPKPLLAETQGSSGGAMFRGGIDCNAWNVGLGGILTTIDVEGVCRKGTLSWGGLPNLFWWIDPMAGDCGMYASQILPPGDQISMELAVEFRREIYARTLA
ncbi:beta-lactamase/transpeptidase-like protein [Aspergillus pseudoustus]|uniref:Beta-lactamase/transpeptidase-like protein n=1 Tax=Aspergillus pseudoustus TaxID=1810923 RepID=A0ABR4IMX0_9EURO